MSIERVELKFNQKVATLVYGCNDFDEGQESNGSGKSALLEAISIAIANKSLRDDASVKDLVREDHKCSKITMELDNPFLKEEMTIIRQVYSNTKSASVEVWINEEEQRQLTSVRDADKFILDKIGIDKEDLFNFFLISKENYTPFLKCSDTKKKAMINRFSQGEMIDPLFDAIDAELKELDAELQKDERTLLKWETRIDQLRESVLGYTPVDVEQRKKEKRKIINQKIDKKDALIEALEDEIDVIETDVKKAEDELKEIPTTDDLQKKVDGFDKDIKDIELDLEETNADLKKYNKKLTTINNTLAGTIECPSCEHRFLLDEDANLEKLEKKKGLIEEELTEIKLDLEEFEEDLSEFEKDRKKIQDQIDEFSKKTSTINRTLRSKKRQISDKEEEIADIEKEIAQLNEDLLAVDEYRAEDESIEWNAQITELTKDKVKLENKIADTSAKIDRKKEKKEIFTQFKTHLANKAIGALEAHANEYLSDTNSDIRIQLDGYKQNRSGTITEKITAQVIRGAGNCPVGRFSSGEKARVELALIVAPLRLINETAPSGGLDLLYLDEIFNSVDGLGTGGALKSLNKADVTSFLVTHSNYNKPYEHTLTMHKQPNGISVLK